MEGAEPQEGIGPGEEAEPTQNPEENQDFHHLPFPTVSGTQESPNCRSLTSASLLPYLHLLPSPAG